MERRRTIIWVAIIVLILSSAAGAAGKAKIVVFRFEPIGVDETTAKIATELLRGELSSGDVFYAVVGEEVCKTPEEAAQLARGMEAEKAVIGSLSGLGEKIIVRASLVDTKTGNVEFEDQLVSTTVDDLDMVMKRLALGLAKKKKHPETAEVEAIIEKETEEPRRRKTFFSTGSTVGYLFPTGNSFGGSGSMVTFEGLGWYETPDFTAETVVGTSISGDAGYIYWDFGLLRFLSRSDLAPFVGGDLGMHWLTAGDFDESGDGLGLSAVGGIVGFRTYDFRLILKGKYTVVFAEINDQSTQRGFAVTFGLTTNTGGCFGRGCSPF